MCEKTARSHSSVLAAVSVSLRDALRLPASDAVPCHFNVSRIAGNDQGLGARDEVLAT